MNTSTSKSPSKEKPQTNLAKKLQLDRTLAALHEHQIKVGYINPSALQDNRYFDYYDPHYQVTFKTQVNYLRHNYQAPSQSVTNCPLCESLSASTSQSNKKIFKHQLASNTKVFFQLTPYPLFNYHYVVIDQQHIPMRVTKSSLHDLSCLANISDNYLACSNSDTEWAGASILQHHHYQLFKHIDLPIQQAKAKFHLQTNAYLLELLHYPAACFRLSSDNLSSLIETGEKLLTFWRRQHTNNTFNLIVHRKTDRYFAYFILRNPKFRTDSVLHLIKSEGIGVIEMAGYGIYPVPEGKQANIAWQKIESNGLTVIKGIIQSNSPVAEKDYAELWQTVSSVLL